VWSSHRVAHNGPQLHFVTKHAEVCGQPSRETRNMFAIAYKTVVGRLRSAWQVLHHSSHPDEEIQAELGVMIRKVCCACWGNAAVNPLTYSPRMCSVRKKFGTIVIDWCL